MRLFVLCLWIEIIMWSVIIVRIVVWSLMMKMVIVVICWRIICFVIFVM